MVEHPEGDVVGRMQGEEETEAVKETDQISVGTGEGSGAGEDHTGAFHHARAKELMPTRLMPDLPIYITTNSCLCVMQLVWFVCDS